MCWSVAKAKPIVNMAATGRIGLEINGAEMLRQAGDLTRRGNPATENNYVAALEANEGAPRQ